MIEIQNNAIPLIFGCFLMLLKKWAILEKINEFDPFIPLKDRKAVAYITRVTYCCYFFLKMGYSTKY